MEDILCFEDALWLRETPIWIAELSNGQTVYQHDGAPGCSEPSTWLRLRNYCKKNDLRIRELYLRYWDHPVYIKRDAEGYFFSKGVGAWFGTGFPAKQHLIIGILEGEKVIKHIYCSPELVCLETKEVDFDPESKNFWWGTGSV